MPATSQLEWLISMTAMIVLFWSRATRDLLKSFGWGIAGTPSIRSATKLPFLAARPIASLGPSHEGANVDLRRVAMIVGRVSPRSRPGRLLVDADMAAEKTQNLRYLAAGSSHGRC